jgi:hypothetical protein
MLSDHKPDPYRKLRRKPPWLRVDTVSPYIEQQREQARSRHLTRQSVHGKPPLEALACGTLLALADQLLAADDPLVARGQLHPLIKRASTQTAWIRNVLSSEAHCSVGLRMAIGPQIQPLRVTGLPRGHTLPWRSCRFGPQHIPQYLPAAWHDRHFQNLIGIHPRLLRRLASIKLVQMTEGGSQQTAARRLGLPGGVHSAAASLQVQQWIRDEENSTRLRAALEALASELDAAGDLIDYGRRRDVLRAWSIPVDDWRQLTMDLRQRHGRPLRFNTDRGGRTREVASVLVWAHITQGEHRFAPLVIAAQLALGRRNELSQSVSRVRYSNGRHWREFKQALDTYADQLATRIDSGTHPFSRAEEENAAKFG